VKAALYARYSMDRQSESSIEDQFRVCQQLAREFEVVARFEDRAISGGKTARPGYQACLAAARAGAFEVILAEDTSRLWRNMAEQSPRLAELSDIGVHVVTRDLDTRQDSAEILGAVMGSMAAAYRKQISYRTRRGMEGRALAGKPTGGKCYGYGPGEAGVVRRIYATAAGGARPAEIARTLNREGIPGPRGPRWHHNAVKRILANPRYAGRLAWGATLTRTGAQDGRRLRPLARPGGPLVLRQIEPLVDPTLWKSAQSVT